MMEYFMKFLLLTGMLMTCYFYYWIDAKIKQNKDTLEDFDSLENLFGQTIRESISKKKKRSG